MDWAPIARNWDEMLDGIEDRWPNLAHSRLVEIDGDREAFTRYLMEAHALRQVEANEEIDEFMTSNMPIDARMDELNDNANITFSGRSIPEGEDVYAEDGDFGDDDTAEPPAGRTD
ncbi:hypothetical protein [Tropicimonas sp. IMCC34011]|uniref:hypothetical protein n=1 Tax=Tropicimonas sp. IMCC34011 TaxID=2248759 RepID=UPI001300A8C3|nr:hypothetical protein [Tropicimonas sp. IMCC34011]